MDLHSGAQVAIEGSAGNHIARVLRLRTGDELTLFNGQGGEYAGSIEDIRRDNVLVRVLEHRALERESPLRLVLAQGISRGERMDWVVQKATELGVSRIQPLFTERSVVHLDDRQAARKVQHWRSIAIAACEQSGRNRVPQIEQPVGLAHLLEQPLHATTALLLSPAGAVRLAEITPGGTEVTVLIGPEGGLDDDEQESARRVGYTPVRLGPRILRTETAAVCALTLLQHRLGDL
jgi:16S rRNA (uracil1498-N3)-methyltransferase